MSDEEVLQQRTSGTSFAITTRLKSFDIDTIISEAYTWSTEENVQKMIKIFERKLLEAKSNETRFRKTLHKFFCVNAKYLIGEKLVYVFYQFLYYIYTQLSCRDKEIQIIYAYYDLLIQQCSYLVPMHVIYGIHNDGELLITSEIYPNIDRPLIEYTDERKILKALRKYGYHFSHVWEIEDYTSREGLITDIRVIMTSLIDEYTEDIYAENPLFNNEYWEAPIVWKETEFYKKQCENRKYKIPTSGIVGKYRNSGDIDTVLFKEKYTENGLVLLYKITFQNGKNTAGFYDVATKLFVSLWTFDRMDTHYGTDVENFILENYYFLTNDAAVDKRRLFALKVVDDGGNYGGVGEYQPIVVFSSNAKKTNIVSSDTHKWSYQDRSKYILTPTTIDSYIRKLPAGYKASEEAKAKAESLGIVLGEDETIVSQFTKAVYRKNEKADIEKRILKK